MVEFIDEVVAQAEIRWGITRCSPGAHPCAHPRPLETHPTRVNTGQRRSPTQTEVSLPRISVIWQLPACGLADVSSRLPSIRWLGIAERGGPFPQVV